MNTNSEPKVSIIVPIYNVENYIEKCVRSLFEQTYGNLEFIFVNDCTKDNSISILNDLIKEYRKNEVIVVNHEINLGLPAARNTGLKISTGEYIYHCDSDDWVDTSIISLLVEEAIMHKADICFCDFYNVNGYNLSIYKQEYHKSFEEYLKSFFTGKSQASVWNKLIKKSIYTENKIQFPVGKPMLEDMRTIIPLYYFAKNIVYVSKPLYYYVRFRDNSITTENLKSSNVIRYDRIENVIGIENFLKEKRIIGVDRELNFLKLMAKKSLLLTADSLSAFNKWKDIFPEANGTMKESNFPWFYKLLSNEINNERWLIPYFWIQIKKIKNKFTRFKVVMN